MFYVSGSKQNKALASLWVYFVLPFTFKLRSKFYVNSLLGIHFKIDYTIPCLRINKPFKARYLKWVKYSANEYLLNERDRVNVSLVFWLKNLSSVKIEMKVSEVRDTQLVYDATITFKRCKMICKSKGGSESHACLQHIDYCHDVDVQGQFVKPSTIIAPLLSNSFRKLGVGNWEQFIVSD